MAPLGGLTQHWGLFNELIWPMGHYGFDPRADHERIPGRGALQKKDQITKEVLPNFFFEPGTPVWFLVCFFGRILKTAFSVAENLIFGSGAPHLINFPKNVPRNL